MSLALGLHVAMQQKCSVEMIHFADFVSLTALELDASVQQALTENPLLESTTSRCDVCGLFVCGGCWFPRPPSARVASGGRDDEFIDPGAGRREVQQRARIELSDGAAVVAAELVEACDERGVLAVPLATLTRRLGFDPSDVSLALQWLRHDLGPGVMADNLTHSLHLQLLALPACPTRTVAEQLLLHHTESLAAADYDAIAADLGISRRRVIDATMLITDELTLYPSVFPPSKEPRVRHPPPDITVSLDRAEGKLVAELAEDRFGLQIAGTASDVSAWHGRKKVKMLLAEARSLISRLERRRTTLRAITDIVVERQGAVFRGNPAVAAGVLTRAEVAQTIGVHESTVSRAVASRIVQCPDRSVLGLAELFDRSIGPKAVIADLVKSERQPMSDRALCDALASRGHDISRRTVAKYRSELGIPSSTDRRPKPSSG